MSTCLGPFAHLCHRRRMTSEHDHFCFLNHGHTGGHVCICWHRWKDCPTCGLPAERDDRRTLRGVNLATLCCHQVHLWSIHWVAP